MSGITDQEPPAVGASETTSGTKPNLDAVDDVFG